MTRKKSDLFCQKCGESFDALIEHMCDGEHPSFDDLFINNQKFDRCMYYANYFIFIAPKDIYIRKQGDIFIKTDRDEMRNAE